MDYSKHSDIAMVEDPFKLRPGTLCDVDITYSVKDTVSWDSSSYFSKVYAGLVVSNSIQSTITIPDDYVTISENDDEYTVSIEPLNSGVLNVDVYYYKKDTTVVEAIPAFSETNQDYYNDYVVYNGVVIPKTVVEIPEIEESNSVVKIKVTPQITNNGIGYYQRNLIELNSQGTITYLEDYMNILRKGKKQISLPSDYTGPYVKQLSDRYKVVEYDSQEWLSGYSEARGLCVYDDKVMITTNKSLCVFSILDDFETTMFEDPNIIGYGISYWPDDTIGVAVGGSIEKYRLKHDFALVDSDNKRVYFREVAPEFTISEE